MSTSTTRTPVHPPPTTDAGLVPDAPAPALDDDIVDEWGRQSFPASDPPANW